MSAMTTDTLDTASNQQLNETFAVEVVGLVRDGDTFRSPKGWQHIVFTTSDMLEYCDYASGVLRMLSKYDWNAWTQGEGDRKRVFVAIYPARGERGYEPSSAKTLERAIVLSLIRHVRAGKVGKAK